MAFPNILKKPDLEPKPLEKISTPETGAAYEIPQTSETVPNLAESGVNKPEIPSPTQPVVSAISAVAPKSAALTKIETVLEEDLDQIYFQLPPEKQAEFRAKGEETASKIVSLMSQAKIQVKKILDLIMDWLKIIPGINRFFLEQEAKIKTDKILALKSETKPENQNKI